VHHVKAEDERNPQSGLFNCDFLSIVRVFCAHYVEERTNSPMFIEGFIFFLKSGVLACLPNLFFKRHSGKQVLNPFLDWLRRIQVKVFFASGMLQTFFT
jgi:hypothetical protein